VASNPKSAAVAESDPHQAETIRLMGARAPLGFLFFLGCVGLATVFEVVRFPERRVWMLGFAAGFALLTTATRLLLRRRPAWTLPLLVGFVNVVGVALNAYHAIVLAPVAPCLWTLTALLASSAVIIPWGGRAQAIASLGTVLSYPLHLQAGNTDVLSWAAGGSYLLIVTAMAVFGAALYARYLWTDFRLTSALSEREARLQSYFDLAPLVGTAVLSTDGSCSEVNDELGRLLAHARDELLRMRWSELIHPDERATVAAQIRRALEGEGAQPSETRLIKGGGAPVYASVGMRGLRGPHGIIDHVLVVVHDITERKRADAEREALLARELTARREAEAASRAKDAFLATVSHELRTPLSPILAWANLLRRGRLGPEQAQRALTTIERNASVQAQLIDDLLDVSRIVSGKLRLERHALELAPVVREAVEVVLPAARAKGVKVEAELEATPCHVSGDAGRLRQVCWNLLSNAIKFTSEGGLVSITLGRGESHARVIVRDTGRGISADFLPHIFERFQQADVGSTREHGGLGIGLAIVRELVDLHGGTVRAESAGEGRGAVFTVELPLVCDSEVADVRRLGAASIAPLEGLRVLVVDDDPASNDVVHALLDSCGAEVRIAVSVGDALAVMEHWAPDVVVSDISMPGEDGYALLRKLRARESEYSQVPAVALTAYAGDTDRERVLSAGFQAHVRKPLRSVELLSAIEAAARGTGRLVSR
jgi:PAS domain S-box-containing protein